MIVRSEFPPATHDDCKAMPKTPSPGRLFDPKRQQALQAKGRRIGYLCSLGASLAFAAVFWFLEELWWLSLSLFAGVFALMAGTTWLVTWKPVPTVRCLGCNGRGWIDDLIETAGNCPDCGANIFAYNRYRGHLAPLVENEISGIELVERRQKSGLPWI